jgi:hypothetical protein
MVKQLQKKNTESKTSKSNLTVASTTNKASLQKKKSKKQSTARELAAKGDFHGLASLEHNTSDGLPSSSVAPYGMGRAALDRLGWRAGVPSINTRGKKALLLLFEPWMDQKVFQTVLVACSDGLRTLKSAHVAIVADSSNIMLA